MTTKFVVVTKERSHFLMWADHRGFNVPDPGLIHVPSHEFAWDEQLRRHLRVDYQDEVTAIFYGPWSEGRFAAHILQHLAFILPEEAFLYERDLGGPAVQMNFDSILLYEDVDDWPDDWSILF